MLSTRLQHGSAEAGISVLRQVVTNRGPNHVVDCFGRKTRQPGYAIVVVTGPAIFRKVRVLNSPAEAALRSLVKLVPESKRALHNRASVTCAGATARGRENR